MTTFLSQKLEDGATCKLFTLCNTLRFFGRKSPEPGDKLWEELIKIGACEHGACIFVSKMASKLGLARTRVRYRNVRRLTLRVPVDLTVMNPAPGCSFHSALLIGGNQQVAVLVNYRQGESSSPVEAVPWEKLKLPKHLHQRRAHEIFLQ